MIDQMIVGERFEKFDGLRFVIVARSCRLSLTGPKYGGVLGMPLFKRIPKLHASSGSPKQVGAISPPCRVSRAFYFSMALSLGNDRCHFAGVVAFFVA
jgi:hypothetical protein